MCERFEVLMHSAGIRIVGCIALGSRDGSYIHIKFVGEMNHESHEEFKCSPASRVTPETMKKTVVRGTAVRLLKLKIEILGVLLLEFPEQRHLVDDEIPFSVSLTYLGRTNSKTRSGILNDAQFSDSKRPCYANESIPVSQQK
jgi:hypothetical protein